VFIVQYLNIFWLLPSWDIVRNFRFDAMGSLNGVRFHIYFNRAQSEEEISSFRRGVERKSL